MCYVKCQRCGMYTVKIYIVNGKVKYGKCENCSKKEEKDV